MAKVITTELQHAGASAANITLDSSKNVTCENNLTVDGNLTVTGTNNVGAGGATGTDYNDNVKVRFGTGTDLEIYHDGTNSYIDSETGVTFIRPDGHLQIKDLSSDEIRAAFNNNGGVELYYDGTKTLETTTQGVTIQGRFKAENASETHEINTSVDSWHTQFIQSNSSSPYGIEIKYTGISRDNNVSEFINCVDTSSVRFKVTSDGDVWNHDDSYGGSDQTLKENIVDATSKLEDIKKLKVRNFNWKSEYFPERSKKKMIGFIAQEVEEVFPSMVAEYNLTGDKDNPVMKKAIKKSWAPILVKALQEATAKIETLEAKVAALEAG